MNKLEVWQRGPVDGIPALLQSVAHALLQAREEIEAIMNSFPEELLWEKPAGMASPGFHLQHVTGVLDRLFTYAQGVQLNEQQLTYLSGEGKNTGQTIAELIANFNNQVDVALKQLSETDEKTLTDARGIGRRQIPTTVIGLLFHSAEHTMRHLGQLLVTVSFLKAAHQS
ncbi:MAG: DinB family protein [Mucilaginibacter sp.]